MAIGHKWQELESANFIVLASTVFLKMAFTCYSFAEFFQSADRLLNLGSEPPFVPPLQQQHKLGQQSPQGNNNLTTLMLETHLEVWKFVIFSVDAAIKWLTKIHQKDHFIYPKSLTLGHWCLTLSGYWHSKSFLKWLLVCLAILTMVSAHSNCDSELRALLAPQPFKSPDKMPEHSHCDSWSGCMVSTSASDSISTSSDRGISTWKFVIIGVDVAHQSAATHVVIISASQGAMHGAVSTISLQVHVTYLLLSSPQPWSWSQSPCMVLCQPSAFKCPWHFFC